MQKLDDLIGQTALKDFLRPKMEIARSHGIALPHLLLCGEKEHGKLTVAASIAESMGVDFDSTSAEELGTPLDFFGIASNLEQDQVFAICNIELLRSSMIDPFARVLAEFQWPIMIGAGPGARQHTVDVKKFTFVGTTSKPWLVDERLRRWCTPCTLASYTLEEATQIVLRIASDKNLRLDSDAASDIALKCKGRSGEAAIFLQRLANHFTFGPSDIIDRPRLREISEFLGSGDVYPGLLVIADQIRTMEGIEFEHWVADLFKADGFQIEITQASGDHGVDLWASKGGRLIAVQCKRWDGSVGEPLVRDLYGAMTASSAQCACLVTTGTFTTHAYQFTTNKPLKLVEFNLLMQMAKAPGRLSRFLDCP